MSSSQPPQSHERAQRLHQLSLVLARLVLIAAIPLCLVIAILFGIVFQPRSLNGKPPSEILPLPITGLPALVLQQGPIVLIVLALLGLLLEVLRRWLRRTSQAVAEPPSSVEVTHQDAPTPAPPTPLPTSPRTVGCLQSTSWLAIASLGLALLMLWALMPLSGAVFDTGGSVSLSGVAMVSPSDGWSVGTFFKNVGGVLGVIWHDHEGTWTQVESPTSSFLRGIWMAPSGDGWAVGDQGTILHEHAGVWTQVASGTTQDILSVSMLSPTEGWAVGGDAMASGLVARPVPAVGGAAPLTSLQRSRWSRERAPRQIQDTCVILHYTHGRWAPVSCPATDLLTSVAVLSNGEAWAMGWDGNILHEAQGQWTPVSSPTKDSLSGVSMLSPSEGWAVGGQAGEGVILQYLNGAWRVWPSGSLGELDAVAMRSPTEGWIVGDGAVLFRLSQGTWSRVPRPKGISPDETLFALTLLPGGQEGWAVGSDHLILHLQNDTWSLVSG